MALITELKLALITELKLALITELEWVHKHCALGLAQTILYVRLALEYVEN